MPTPPEPDAATCFVINLCSSMMPVSRADVPDLPVLRKHMLYVSRRKEDGRERHRLHLGFFSSDSEATHVVIQLRDSFPTAWVVRANSEDLRHLRTPKPTEPPPPAKRQPESAPVSVEPATRATVLEHLELQSRMGADEPDVNGLLEAFDASESDATRKEAYYGPGIPGTSERATPRPRERKQPRQRPAAARRRPRQIEVPEGRSADHPLSDSRRVKHLSVKPMEPSITARILRRFMKLKKDPDDPGH